MKIIWVHSVLIIGSAFVISCGDSAVSSPNQADGSRYDVNNSFDETDASISLDLGTKRDTNISDLGSSDIATSKCGNGIINDAEQCDGANLSLKNCADLGFVGGTLSCNNDCTFNTTNCYKCGDGIINGADKCDGSDFGGKTCISEGFAGGTLACSNNCNFNTTGCFKCGDYVVNGSEQCDGTALNNKSCKTFGFYGGSLSCKNDCTFDILNCNKCGDGIVNGSEQCDGTALNGNSCILHGFASGTITCNNDCTLNYSGCIGGIPGSVCTQQDKSCAAGFICVFLEKWDAPKGTCLRQLDQCSAYNDSRCAAAGKNYSVMCGEYTWMTEKTNVCFLLCKLGNITYDCPAAHKCIFLNNFNVCVPQ